MSELTDFELNKAIAKALGLTNDDGGGYHQPRLQILSNPEGHQMVDYCNNWSDLMPLVVERGVSLTSYPNNNLWDAEYDDFITTNNNRFKCTNANPQRALAECLLKVLEGK